MILHDKLWALQDNTNNDINNFIEHLNISKVQSQMLYNRGIKTIEEAKTFLNPHLDSLDSPFLIKGMKKVVDRINKAIDKNENIWIYGSTDLAGIIKVAIFMLYFDFIGYKAKYYLSDRLKEGKSIDCHNIKHIKNLGGELIINLNSNDSNSISINKLISLGIDNVLININQKTDNYSKEYTIINDKAYDDLSTTGIVFKIVQALTPKEIFKDKYMDYIDIAALGILAEGGSIKGCNRVIVRNGLKQVNKTRNIGLKVMIKALELDDYELNSEYISSILTPKINAFKSIEKASLGVKLLLCMDYDEAHQIIKEIFDNNSLQIYIDNCKKIRNQNYFIEIKEASEKKGFITLNIDMQLESKDIGFNFLEELEELEPYGSGNSKPKFLLRNLIIDRFSWFGNNNEHLKLLVQDGNRIFDCVGFNFKGNGKNLIKGEKIDIVFNLERKLFKGVETIQLNLIDLRFYRVEAYEDKQIIMSYYGSFYNIINDKIDLETFKQTNNSKKIKDFRNIKDRSRIVLNMLNSKKSNLVIINTLKGLIEIILNISDIDDTLLDQMVFLNSPCTRSKKNCIVVNPIYRDIDFEAYENVLIYDMPLSKDRLDFMLKIKPNVYYLYNYEDIESVLNFFKASIPGRNDLVSVYKFFRQFDNEITISNYDIYQEFIGMNISKIEWSLFILDSAGLINCYKDNSQFTIKTLPPPENKIDILETELYSRINNMLENFKAYKEYAFSNKALQF